MKSFAEFFYYVNDNFVPVCGSRGTIQLDGRLSIANQCKVAREYAQKHGFGSFNLLQGERLLNAQVIYGFNA